MDVQADNVESELARLARDVRQVRVPDAMLGVLAAGGDLAIVAVPKARVHAQHDVAARGIRLRILRQHERRARVELERVLRQQLERVVVEEVRAEQHVARLEACGQRAPQLAAGHGVDVAALRAQEAQDREVGVGLLRIAHDVEAAAGARAQVEQLAGPRDDRRPVVHEERRSMLTRERQQQLVGKRARLHRCPAR